MCSQILKSPPLKGQIAIKIKCNNTDIKVGVLGLYLSPDSYRYGQDAEGFFNQASALWQDLFDCDLIVGAGDVNARTKEIMDMIPDIDGKIVPKRTNPDKTKNAHADSFLTFLKDNRTIILNGRITPELNNYTFVSTRGCSVPDYFFCPIDNLYNCTELKTILMSEAINMLGLIPPRTLPDHSILSSTFVTSVYDLGKNFENMNANVTNRKEISDLPQKSYKKPKKNLSKIDKSFFMSVETLNAVIFTINRLENIVSTKTEIDQLWHEVKNVFLSEMGSLPDVPISNSKKQNRKFRKSKEFWNEELEKLWSDACNAEKKYLNFKVHSNPDFVIKNEFRTVFKTAQKHFDKKFRYFQRQYKHNQSYELETSAKSHPAAMWAQLKRLNNPPTARAALEIIREDETISRDLKEILERWYQDISKLFSGVREDPEIVFNENFYQEILNKKEEFENMPFEQQSLNCDYNSDNMNNEISYDEVSDAIDKSKYKKSYLEIPNEVMKNKNAKLLLFKFFNLCFISGFNPSDWDFSDIIPIPKKDKDARDPLQNRCITIVCCVAKIYSSILNKRLQKYLETNNILVEEQNGFRVGRSCIDHIFVMCTVLRNRKLLGQDTFICFIDYKKAFDSVDRNLLL